MKLPFLTPPPEPTKRVCGNSVSGTIELPVLGGLTVGEADHIARLLADEPSAFVAAARVSDAIGKAENISISEAFSIVESAINGGDLEAEADAIRLRHIEAIQQVATVMNRSSQRALRAQVTAVLSHRLNLPDWKPEDTDTLHRVLFEDVVRLIEDETAAEEQEPPAPADDALLGKPPEVSGSGRKRTGPRSGGNS